MAELVTERSATVEGMLADMQAELESIRTALTQELLGKPPMVAMALVEAVRDLLHGASPNRAMPVDRVRWVPWESVVPNDYNPNSVARIEMQLLLRSILADGYTQPVVTIWDPEMQKYVIVDGFHRYYVMKESQEVRDRCNGLLPIVVIDKSINDRMASTVRHNRARGKHSLDGMANLVFSMLEEGWNDADICNELGMEPEELLRLKHITGFSKLFENVEYSKAWMSKNQILTRKRYQEKLRRERQDAS